MTLVRYLNNFSAPDLGCDAV